MAEHTLFPSITPDRGEQSADEPELDLGRIEAALANGSCPFCDAYTGEHPGRHASKAHEDDWEAYTDARED